MELGVFSSFIGTARVPVENLVFPEQDDFANATTLRERLPVEKKVQRMQEIYRLEGCRPLERRNYLPAKVSRKDLEHVAGASSIILGDSSQSAREPPLLRLQINVRIIALQGLHRVEAAKRSGSSTWWSVELYDDDISAAACHALRNEFENASCFSDGHVFKEIQEREVMGDDAGKRRWLSRLTSSKRAILGRVLKRRAISQALYALHGIPGLWEDSDGFNIGVLHKMLAIMSDEELVHYLSNICKVYLAIVGSKSLLKFVDHATVKHIELRVPGLSQQDDDFITGALRQGLIFSQFPENEKPQLLDNLRRVNELIPSLYTFRLDFKYLRPCALVMKRLFMPSQPFNTVRQAARYAFKERNDMTHTSFAQQFLQLYLHIMRNVFELSEDTPLVEQNHRQIQPKPEDPRKWHELAIEAQALGFNSLQIDAILRSDPDEAHARFEADVQIRTAVS
ncbi:hypothetical protein CCHR01_18546 [Colletotrichum chrysophilum]|uniref:Uncharacterized protein n=1 Tax=Colletotrichum chrysophilum TaxID=1836956 RepID=A0AAD9A4D5_9PEZI|nr:hypothetical protein CCHR01_18546 [Colletotrichum chrysophilum]